MKRPWLPTYEVVEGVLVCKMPLSKGLFALIDECYLAEVQRYTWCAEAAKLTYYAFAKVRKSGRQRTLRLHRLIADLLGIEGQVDHKDGNGLDCRARNLRRGAGSLNCANQRKRRRPASSQYKGVSRRPYNRWQGQIQVSGKRTHLGYFATEEQAAVAYDKAALVLWGEYAHLNFPRAA